MLPSQLNFRTAYNSLDFFFFFFFFYFFIFLNWIYPNQVLLAVSFAWGPVLLDVMQSLVLLLHVCPFDTGDRIVFRGRPARSQVVDFNRRTPTAIDPIGYRRKYRKVPERERKSKGKKSLPRNQLAIYHY